ncbi:MAG TPA: hypothetical protein VG637_07110 [Actinomycetes bacterium]|nr:hypothetical protein [Actinomycetes bacterium]
MAATTEGDEELLLLDPKAEPPDKLAMTYTGLSGRGSAFRAIFELAAAVGARGCAVLDADLRSVSPSWIDRLVGPVLGTATTWSPPCTPATSWTAPSPTRSPSR